MKRQRLILAARKIDQLLLAVAGQENRIVHQFLRIASFGFLLVVASIIALITWNYAVQLAIGIAFVVAMACVLWFARWMLVVLQSKTNTISSNSAVAPNSADLERVDSSRPEISDHASIVPVKKHHLQDQPIPVGYVIFEDLAVAGIHAHKADAIEFVTSKSHWLELQADPSNPYDKNAIRIIGCSNGSFGVERRFIGYVPKESAAAIAHSEIFDRVLARLVKTYLSDQGFVGVEFQIIGPKAEKQRYLSYWSNQPATYLQKEFYCFVGKTPPKSLTAGEAKAFQAGVEATRPETADDWEHFVDIWDALNDPDERELYEIKKVNIGQFRKAVQLLQSEGKQLDQLDIDDVVDKLFEIKPNLRRTN